MLTQINLNRLPFAIVGFAGRSGTGKTTLLKRLIPELKNQGLKLGLIKHSHHRIVFDNSGTTKQVLARGVDVFASSQLISVKESHQHEEDTALMDGINDYIGLGIDLLLIEGFKSLSFPKIELHRQVLNRPLLAETDLDILAIASDNKAGITMSDINLPLLDLAATTDIAKWIMANIVLVHQQRHS